MDFPVEATVHLDVFGSERRAQDVLVSHGFRLTDLGGRRLRVRGSFSQLRAVKPQLELLLRNQPASSGTGSGCHGDAGSGSRGRRVPASGSSRRSPTKPGQETIVMDADVFQYANRLRKKELEDVLTVHTVSLTVQDSGDGSTVTVRGRNSGAAAHELQSLFDRLRTSLQTQEVPRTALDRDGHALLQRIQQRGDVYDSVLVRETRDVLRLVGPPEEGVRLRRQLTGKSAGRGRGFNRDSRLRSSWLPASLRKDRGQRASEDDAPPPGGAAGHSPPRNLDDRTEPERDAGGPWRWLKGRSHVHNSQKKKTERPKDVSPDRRDTAQNPTSPTSVHKVLGWFSRKKQTKGRL